MLKRAAADNGSEGSDGTAQRGEPEDSARRTCNDVRIDEL